MTQPRTKPTAQSSTAPRVALIHALAHSVAPINTAFDALWPQAQRQNLLDDSLSQDLAASRTGLDDAMTQRFLSLAAYAVGSGAQGILFTCSAFGTCIDAVKAAYPNLPVLKPNEAMLDDVTLAWRSQGALPGAKVGLISSFGPTLVSMPPEFDADVPLITALCADAMDALNRGDTAFHDAAVLRAAQDLVAQGAQFVALAQFSMARATPLLRAHLPTIPVFTTPEAAVRRLQGCLS